MSSPADAIDGEFETIKDGTLPLFEGANVLLKTGEDSTVQECAVWKMGAYGWNIGGHVIDESLYRIECTDREYRLRNEDGRIEYCIEFTDPQSVIAEGLEEERSGLSEQMRQQVFALDEQHERSHFEDLLADLDSYAATMREAKELDTRVDVPMLLESYPDGYYLHIDPDNEQGLAAAYGVSELSFFFSKEEHIGGLKGQELIVSSDDETRNVIPFNFDELLPVRGNHLHGATEVDFRINSEDERDCSIATAVGDGNTWVAIDAHGYNWKGVISLPTNEDGIPRIPNILLETHLDT